MRELDKILATYHLYRKELEKVNEKRQSIEDMSRLNEKGNSSDQIYKEPETTKIPKEPKMVRFECDSNKVFAEVNKLGKLVEKFKSRIKYKHKKLPLISVCEKGSGMEQLDTPRGVTVDNKQEIFMSQINVTIV